jgi:hypothetical protein
MIRRKEAIFVGVLYALTASHGLEVTGTAPQVTIKTDIPSQYRAMIEAQMNAAMAESFNASIGQANEDLQKYGEQKELAQGFANANAYSMHSATLQGYQNYRFFALGSGLMVGVQAPSLDLSYLGKVDREIKRKGDLYAGAGVGGAFFNAGVNAGFLVPGLYLNVKYGALDQEIDAFTFKFNSWGIGANYRLFDSRSALGLVKWRGVSVGTGFYSQTSEVSALVEPDGIKDTVPFREAVLNSASNPSERQALGQVMTELGFPESKPGAPTELVPAFNMGLDVTAMTIPLDVNTGVSFLWGLFNVSAGAGVDMTLGSSKVTLVAAGRSETKTDTAKVAFSDGEIEFDASSEGEPSFLRPRINAGVGLGLGPVKVDVPVIYYPASGFAAGASVLVVW